MSTHPTLLEQPEGPLDPEAMRLVALDLNWDGKHDRCARLADEMMNWWAATSRAAAPASLQWHDAQNSFYFWLGVRAASTAVADGRATRSAANRRTRLAAKFGESKPRRRVRRAGKAA